MLVKTLSDTIRKLFWRFCSIVGVSKSLKYEKIFSDIFKNLLVGLTTQILCFSSDANHRRSEKVDFASADADVDFDETRLFEHRP